MTALFQRMLLATCLVLSPVAVFAASEDDGKTDEAVTEADATNEADGEVETAADDTGDGEASEDEGEADGAAASDDEDRAAIIDSDEEWAKKLRQRHHEGDVALGVCGGRMSALMWFYEASVADGREDLQPAYDALKESRSILKKEAERRAVEDGVGTSVSVMNEHGQDLWKALIEATEEPETFQDAHDELFASVQECLTLFFNRARTPKETEADEAEAEDAGAKDEADGDADEDAKAD